MSSELLPKVLLDQVAQRFKVLSEPIRLELLNQLMVNGEMTVTALVDAVGQQQANTSKHLAMMAREGIVSRRKDGLKVFYKIADPTIHGLCTLVCGRLREEASIQQRIMEAIEEFS